MGLTQITTGGLDSDINIDSNTLKVDGTNNRVGIGTAHPDFNLDVGGPIGVFESNNIVWHDGTGARAGQLGFTSGEVFTIKSSNSQTERLRIDSSGQVGIGTSSNSQQLHVSDSTNYQGILVNGSAAPSICFDNATNTAVKWRVGLSGVNVSNFCISQAGNNDKFIINSSGNVGIATASPAGRLSVGPDQDIVFGNQASSGTGGTGRFVATGGVVYLQAGQAATSGSDAPLVVTGYGGVGERLRIDSSGRLLVGSNTARSNFFNSTFSAGLQLEGTGTARRAAIIGADGNASIILARQQSGAAGGNTPPSNGHLIGSVSYQGNDGAQFVVAADISAEVDGNPGSDNMPGRLVFSTNGGAGTATERMRIDSSGRVLIGATAAANATSLLTVQNGSGDAQITLNSGPTSESVINMGDTGDFNIGAIRYDQTANAFRFFTSNAERMRITSTGIGIGGVTSPFDKLQVRTATDCNFVFSSAGSTEASFEIFNNAGSSNTPLNYRASEHKFKIQANEKMRLDSTGRLLIGASTATFDAAWANLQLRSTDGAAIVIAREDATVTADEDIGSIRFYANDAGSYHECAKISAEADDAFGASSKPTSLRFSTTAAGASSPTEHMRLSAGGRLTGNAVAIERVFAMLYSRLSAHGTCSSIGAGATFTDFYSSTAAFTTVSRSVTSAPQSYRFIGDDKGNAFTFFVSCSNQVAFSLAAKDSDAPSYRSWVCVHEDFLNALAGLPSNSTRTSLP